LELHYILSQLPDILAQTLHWGLIQQLLLRVFSCGVDFIFSIRKWWTNFELAYRLALIHLGRFLLVTRVRGFAWLVYIVFIRVMLLFTKPHFFLRWQISIRSVKRRLGLWILCVAWQFPIILQFLCNSIQVVSKCFNSLYLFFLLTVSKRVESTSSFLMNDFLAD